MLIQKANLDKDILKGKNVLITGGGGGIGYETARALAYLGANIIIAEIERHKGFNAEKTINNELESNQVCFYPIDIADENQIEKLHDFVKEKYGILDVIINNATITPMGAVDETSINDWDKSYFVNLKAPVMLVQKFLPDMKEQNSGVIIFVSSSGAAPYMGAYEIFKTAQVELSNTLALELDHTDIYTFTIGPGLVKTETAKKAIEIVANNMGMTTEEFYLLNANHILDVESAGVGFALSVLKASEYCGQEIGSIQVLMDYNLMNDDLSETDITDNTINYNSKQKYMNHILITFDEQYNGWRNMNVFERQWVLRDFKKNMGLSAEQALEHLKVVNESVKQEQFNYTSNETLFFEKLKNYWKKQLKLLQGYEKNKTKLEENTQIIMGWIYDIEQFLR